MALYIVVHHHRDSNQPWQNAWVDDQVIEAITTTSEIGRMCQRSQQSGTPVYVHRCAWGECTPVISCATQVVRVDHIDKKTSLVTFEQGVACNVQPPRQPYPGQNFYEAEAVL